MYFNESFMKEGLREQDKLIREMIKNILKGEGRIKAKERKEILLLIELMQIKCRDVESWMNEVENFYEIENYDELESRLSSLYRLVMRKSKFYSNLFKELIGEKVEKSEIIKILKGGKK